MLVAEKKCLIAFILFFLLHQNKTDAQRIIKYSDKNFGYTVIRDSIFSVDYMNKHDSVVKQIIITRLKDNKVVQEIKPKEQGVTRWFGKNFLVQDANFDGFNDIMLYQYGKGINSTYLVWLYNPAKNKFEECEQLENITSPEFDYSKKLIYSNWKGGAGYFGNGIYIYKNGKYILLFSLEVERSEHKKDTVLLTQKTLTANGKFIKKSKYYPNVEGFRLFDSLSLKKQ